MDNQSTYWERHGRPAPAPASDSPTKSAYGDVIPLEPQVTIHEGDMYHVELNAGAKSAHVVIDKPSSKSTEPLSLNQTLDALRYIAASPSRENGGFHEQAILCAKSALFYLTPSKSTDGERIKLVPLSVMNECPQWQSDRCCEALQSQVDRQLPAILASHDAARDAEWMKALGREGIVVAINPATGKPEPFDVIKFQTGAAAVREQTAREIFTELDDHVKIGGLFLFPEDDYQTFKAKYLAAVPLKEKAPPSLEEIAAIIRSTWEVGTETIEAAAAIVALWEVPTEEG